MESNRKAVSFLFRDDVLVGDLYNYYTDSIFKSRVVVPSHGIHIDQDGIPRTERYFFFNQPDTFNNSNLDDSIEQDFVDLNLPWFSHFLKTSLSSRGVENEAIVSVLFRVVRRTETLDQHFINSKMYDYQLESGGWATHLVEQVVYGAELICTMRRPVDWSRETKTSAVENIYLIAKSFFDRIIGPNAVNAETPTELDKVSCRILSSLEDVQPAETSFRQSCDFLRDVINFKEDNQPAKLWRPIYVVRRQIPNQIETRIMLDKIIDERFEMERKLHWIMCESRRISKNAFLTRIPPMEKVIYQFISLLQPIEKEMMKFDVNLSAKSCLEIRKCQEKIGNGMKTVADGVLLSNMVDWLMKRRKEIDVICSLFKDTVLDVFDMEDIESRPPSAFEKRARVFVLKIDYTQDPLIECIQHLIGRKPIEAAHSKLPVFPAVSSGRKRLTAIRKAFREFSEEARWGSNDKNFYHIGLVPALLPIKDATIKTIYYPAVHSRISSPELCLSISNNRQDDQPSLSSDISAGLNQKNVEKAICEDEEGSLFDLIAQFQSHRMDDQRCSFALPTNNYKI